MFFWTRKDHNYGTASKSVTAMHLCVRFYAYVCYESAKITYIHVDYHDVTLLAKSLMISVT